MTDLLLPRLTDAMEEGTIVKWLIDHGQPVSTGDEIAEIETDKATTAITAEIDGFLEIVAPEGTTAAVDAVIARILATRTASAGDPPSPAPGPPEPQAPVQPEPVPVAVTAGTNGTSGGGHAPVLPDSGGAAHAATPLARRIARAQGVALATVTGSGPRGRITKLDVLRAAGIQPEPDLQPVPAAATPAAAMAAAADPGPVPGGATLQPATRLQQTIARRMSEQALVPVFQVQTDVRMDAVLALRSDLRRLAGDQPAPSVNDLIIRACALALRDHPLVNGSYRPDGYLVHDHINVGMAVASAAGLLVATIPDTDQKTLGQIAREARALATKVRGGEATPAELTGGTFTVSNLGMFGMTEITAVINPPQAAILGVGTSRTTLSRTPDGGIADEQLVSLNLTCDHRILNGADGARFLQDVKALLESPLRMAL